MGIASSLGACAGGLIGAASVTKDPSGWRNFAWLCVALRASMCSFFFFFYRPAKVPRPSYTFAEVMHKCDWIGSLILATGLVLLLFGLIGGGESWSWSVSGQHPAHKRVLNFFYPFFLSSWPPVGHYHRYARHRRCGARGLRHLRMEGSHRRYCRSPTLPLRPQLSPQLLVPFHQWFHLLRYPRRHCTTNDPQLRHRQ